MFHCLTSEMNFMVFPWLKPWLSPLCLPPMFAPGWVGWSWSLPSSVSERRHGTSVAGWWRSCLATSSKTNGGHGGPRGGWRSSWADFELRAVVWILDKIRRYDARWDMFIYESMCVVCVYHCVCISHIYIYIYTRITWYIYIYIYIFIYVYTIIIHIYNNIIGNITWYNTTLCNSDGHRYKW